MSLKKNKKEYQSTLFKFKRLNNLKKEKDLILEEETNFELDNEEKSNSFFKKIFSKTKKDIAIDLEENLDYQDSETYNYEENKEEEEMKKKDKPKNLFKEKLTIVFLVSIILIVALNICYSIYLEKKVEVVDISFGQNVNLEEYETIKGPSQTNSQNSSKEKGVDYFSRVAAVRNRHYDDNEQEIDSSIKKAEEEAKKEEAEKAEEEAKKETETETKTDTDTKKEETKEDEKETSIPKLPKNEKVRNTITTLNSLLETTLLNSSKNYGGKNPLELSSEKIDKLDKVLTSKGSSYKASTLYDLDNSIFKDKLKDYDLKDFAVITTGSLKGEVIYIGNDVSGLKDDDGSYWFGYNLYSNN